jgi:hypothetical protein
MINVRTKGAVGEREIAAVLNKIIQDELRQNGRSEEEIESFKYHVQRNTNQSAVGGKDLINTFGYAIEIKRQQALSIKAWWQQCCRQAATWQETPVLLYRANHKPWRAVMDASIESSFGKPITAPGDFEFDVFLQLFRIRVARAIERGELVNS